MKNDVIMLSSMLVNPRKYKREFELLFDKLTSTIKIEADLTDSSLSTITTLNEVITLHNNQQIQLDHQISQRYTDNAFIPKLDIYAKDSDIAYGYADHHFSEVKYIMSKNGSKIVIKPKRRLVNIVSNAAKAARDKACMSFFYPFKTRIATETSQSKLNRQHESENFILENDPNQFLEPDIRQVAHIQTPMPNGKALSEIISSLSDYPLHEKIQITLSLLDNVETLQLLNIRHLHLSPHNIFYDTAEKKITILNYQHAQRGDDVLSGVPSLPTYHAPEVINKQPHIKSDNYAVAIILAQLFGVSLLDIQKIQMKINERNRELSNELASNDMPNIEFAEMIADKLREKYLSHSHYQHNNQQHLLSKIFEITEKLLQPMPDQRIDIATAKKEIFTAASINQANTYYHIQDRQAKLTFFNMSYESNNNSLIMPLFNKIESILLFLPWQKTSRIGFNPTSIKSMQKILRQEMTPEDKLQAIYAFCKKEAAISKLQKKLRGRHDITHELIKILANMKKTSIPDLIIELETLHTEFENTFSVKKPLFNMR